MQIAKSCKIPDPPFFIYIKLGSRGCAQKKLITTMTSIITIPEVYAVVINLEAFYRFPRKIYSSFSTANNYIYIYILFINIRSSVTDINLMSIDSEVRTIE